jgi:hypothetical protein
VTELLLDISTVVERDAINIRSKRHPDGKVYTLVNLDEFGAFEFETIVSLDKKAGKLKQLKRKPTAAEERTVRWALGEILKLIVIDLEPAVLAEIEDIQRAKIVGAWTDKITSGATEGEAPAAPGSTTAASSRASKRSTAATRKGGSTRRRSS